MSNENSIPLNPSVKQSVIAYITTHYGPQLSRIYPGVRIEKLVQSLSDDDLTDLALGETPFHKLVEILPAPEIRSVYWHIIQKHPNLTEMYPQIDIYALPENQLERLATETSPIPILGKPSSELDILLQQQGNPMDPPKNKSRIRRAGNPRKTSLGKYKGKSPGPE